MPPGTTTPRRWTLQRPEQRCHFPATYHGVRTLPRAVSYAIGQSASWIAWRRMKDTREALADTSPRCSPRIAATLETPRPQTLRSYNPRDVIDFLHALGRHLDAYDLFDLVDHHRAVFESVLAVARAESSSPVTTVTWENRQHADPRRSGSAR